MIKIGWLNYHFTFKEGSSTSYTLLLSYNPVLSEIFNFVAILLNHIRSCKLQVLDGKITDHSRARDIINDVQQTGRS